LQGNTQISRQVRQVTKGIDPESQAIWPLKELHQRLVEYAYEIYDTVDHPALGQSPRAAMDNGFLRSGMRLHRIVPYDHEFLIFTLPTTRKGTAKVSQGRGVKIHYLYYWCEAFRDPSIESTKVAVRYDPFDVGIAYAFVSNRWANAIPNTTQRFRAILSESCSLSPRSCTSGERIIPTKLA
jgi:hypothetical protein